MTVKAGSQTKFNTLVCEFAGIDILAVYSLDYIVGLDVIAANLIVEERISAVVDALTPRQFVVVKPLWLEVGI